MRINKLMNGVWRMKTGLATPDGMFLVGVWRVLCMHPSCAGRAARGGQKIWRYQDDLKNCFYLFASYSNV